MKYVDGLMCGLVFGVGLYIAITAVGAALKTVQWIGKKLGVKPFGDL